MLGRPEEREGGGKVDEWVLRCREIGIRNSIVILHSKVTVIMCCVFQNAKEKGIWKLSPESKDTYLRRHICLA